MTDVPIESPTSEGTAATSRRRRRTTRGSSAATTTTRRRRLRGADLIESLRESVEQLIKENRSLKRQLAKVSAGGDSAAASGVERTLRSIQRKVQRAVGSDGTSRRRTRSAATNGRRRTSRRRSAE
jgi:hypothetical protein